MKHPNKNPDPIPNKTPDQTPDQNQTPNPNQPPGNPVGADWTLGPFTRPAGNQPVIRPDPATLFDCPMRQKPVAWQARHTFNPAAIVKDGKVCLLYRAEDDIGAGIGGYTSRLGLALSDDGIHFRQTPRPVLYPDVDQQQRWEWEGGCEDPRVVELEDGSYVLFYTQYHRGNFERNVTVGIATSSDLLTWTKHGPLIARNAKHDPDMPRKSAAPVCEVRDGRLIATKINGRYQVYIGEGEIGLYSTTDFHDWTAEGVVMGARAGKLDSAFPECGPPAVLTRHGIVLLYNGKNACEDGKRDPGLPPHVYSAGQALFDAANPTKLLDRTIEPFFKPETDWEKSGQYKDGTTFIEGLVLFRGRWFLYYGCADTFVGVATSPASL
ncbi:MAG: glycoside hydrolase family 130 protein [Opitutaceae bacterium]|jgi:predicted GH43/DUF377 family glycosyl hydrolase|nr:glycoside hydrolase family 130 protein [Opitutaceae bacterium]